MPRLASGLVVGRFLPPHLGHLHLLENARRQVERLYVQIIADVADAPPVDLRAAWLRALLPDAVVLVRMDDDSASPLPSRIDAVFGSGPEARRAATALGARLLPVDPDHRAIPLRSAQVRANPRACADALPDVVRRWYGFDAKPHPREVVRVAIVGPECTGKSTLAARLSAMLGGTVVPEHAEALLAGGACDRHALRPADLEDFARGQIASEDALAALRGGLLLCDSDLLTTRLYAEQLLGGCPEWVVREARDRRYDLTLLTAPGTPWEDAPHRVDPTGRETFFAHMKLELERMDRAPLILTGDWENRFQTALEATQRVCVGRLQE